MMTKRIAKAESAGRIVDFAYDNTSYQIDPQRRKVYRKWIEVESARTYLIISAWSALNTKKAV
jgi:hypothetical protein